MKKKDHPILVGKTKETIAKLQGKSISTVSTKAQGVPRLKKLDVGSMIQKSNAAAKEEAQRLSKQLPELLEPLWG